MSTQNEFAPRMIGCQNVEAYETIKKLYEQLMSSCSAFVYDCQDLFNDIELGNEIFFELIRKSEKDLTLTLQQRYVKSNNIIVPGINMDKLIAADLVDFPEDYIRIVYNWKVTNEIIDKCVANRFCYPLKSLISPEGRFSLNDEFEEKLINFTAAFTENDKQNEVLDMVVRWCDATNDLIEIGFVKSRGIEWTNIGQHLEMAIAKNKLAERPLSPVKEMFNRHYPFEKFGFHKPFDVSGHSRNTIIN